jgi:hypothetical protein
VALSRKVMMGCSDPLLNSGFTALSAALEFAVPSFCRAPHEQLA